MKSGRQNPRHDVMTHLAAIRNGMSAEQQAAYDERVLAIRTVLELVEQRKKRRLAQRTVAERMGVSQPVKSRGRRGDVAQNM